MGLAVGDIVNTTYTAKCDGQQIRYSLHWKCITGSTGSTAEGDLFSLSGYMQSVALNSLFARMIDSHTSNLEFTGCMCSRIYPTRTVVMNSATSSFGSAVLTETPANVAVVITKRTLTAGRRGRGSIHLSGVANEWLANSEISPAGLAVYEPLADELFAGRIVSSIGLSLQPGLYHNLAAPLNFSPLFDCRLEQTSRTMRRRTVRVGI